MKIRNLILVLLIFLSTQPFNGAEAAARYQALNFVSGRDSSIELKIRTIDLELDLLKSSNIRLRVKVNKLFTSNASTGSFRITAYDVSGGGREFVSSQSREIIRGATGDRTLSMDAGRFINSTKSFEFELYDTANNLVNIYSATIAATNVNLQVSSGAGLNLGANCPGDSFGECQLDELFKRVHFVARRQRHPTTRVIKDSNGLYTVTLPVPRQAFTFLEGNRVRAVNFGQVTTNGGNSSTVIADIVDSLGIGVEAPVSALLHVGNGTGIVPSLIIEPGPLASNNPNGSIEFDGNNLYITKNGVRTSLGAQGPAGATGAQGAQGPQGATGPQGPAGTLDSNNGANITGDVSIDGNLDVTGTITAGLIDAPTPSKVGADFDVNGQTAIDVTGINYIKLVDSNTATIDEIFTLSGGVTGQKVILHLQNDMNIRADNAATANSIQWGRGTAVGSTRTLSATEMYEFVYDGNAWFLISRYIL